MSASDNVLNDNDVEQWRLNIRQDTFANYHYQMGLALMASNESALAEAAFHRALSIKPLYPECAIELALLFQRTGRATELADLEQRMHAQDADWQTLGWCGHAEVMQQRGDLKASADAWREAARRGVAKGHWGLLACVLRLGENEAAQAMLEAAPPLARDEREDMAQQFFLLGNSLLQTEAWDRARLAFLGCLQLKPDHAQAPASFGIAEQFCGHHAKAVAFLQQAVERQPGTGWINAHLGLALQAVGDLEAAERAHQAAQAAASDDDACAVNLCLIALARQDIAGAEALVRRVLARHPMSSPAETHLAVVLQTKGQAKEAAQAWQRAIALNHRYTRTAVPLRPWLAPVFAELDHMVARASTEPSPSP